TPAAASGHSGAVAATFTSAARALSASEMLIRLFDGGSSPEARSTTADRIAIAASFPAMTSASATPTFIGDPSGSPVIAIHPHSAWTTKSYPGLGLVAPNPE